MTNKVGVTFVRGVWYKSNYKNFFFQYLRDKKGYGVLLSGRYSGGVLEKEIVGSYSYANSPDYLDNATEATRQDLISIGVICAPVVNNSYSVF